MHDSGALLLRRGRRDEVEHRILCRLLQHAGRHAARVAIDGAGDRIRGLRRDVGESQGDRVRHAVMAGGVHQPYGIFGRYRVEIGRLEIAPLGELALIPAVALQPFARLEARNPRAHPAHDLGDRRCIAKMHVVELLDAAVGDVGMAVDEPRGCRTSVQIDPQRCGAGEAQDLPVRADRDDLSVADRQGLGDGVARIHGQNVSVEQQQLRPAAPAPARRRRARAGPRPEAYGAQGASIRLTRADISDILFF